MGTITASQVKELRELTGAGMMECKKALTESEGDMDAAVELMRKKGQAKAAKKAGRVAAEGLVEIAVSSDNKKAAIVEVNSETDFVAREALFIDFAKQAAQLALENNINEASALLELPIEQGSEQTVEERRKALVAKIGENIQIRRAEVVEAQGQLGAYIHGGRIGVVVDAEAEDLELIKSLAMHIAASNPEFVKPEDVSDEVINKEKTIFVDQAKESGKPAEIIEKMVSGRVKKFLNEVSLYGQPYVKNPDKTVGELMKEQSAAVHTFIRYEVGEGVEKEETNFAEEVMAQAQGN